MILKKLVGTKADCTGLEISDPNYPVVITDEKDNLEIAELTCGTKDIRYDVLKHFGGVEGDDLYQDFEHFSVNALDMSVTPGQIVTGSFSFMGSNNPELVQEGSGEKTLYTYTKATSYDSSTTYYSDEKGTVAAPQPTSEGDITGGNYLSELKTESLSLLELLKSFLITQVIKADSLRLKIQKKFLIGLRIFLRKELLQTSTQQEKVFCILTA
ncbi:MAG: hypothetical protein L6V86_08955 [Treponema sp.]|nr:MAG: hypothetical protein L6V86_08955 [Treponema sp.]